VSANSGSDLVSVCSQAKTPLRRPPRSRLWPEGCSTPASFLPHQSRHDQGDHAHDDGASKAFQNVHVEVEPSHSTDIHEANQSMRALITSVEEAMVMTISPQLKLRRWADERIDSPRPGPPAPPPISDGFIYIDTGDDPCRHGYRDSRDPHRKRTWSSHAFRPRSVAILGRVLRRVLAPARYSIVWRRAVRRRSSPLRGRNGERRHARRYPKDAAALGGRPPSVNDRNTW